MVAACPQMAMPLPVRSAVTPEPLEKKRRGPSARFLAPRLAVFHSLRVRLTDHGWVVACANPSTTDSETAGALSSVANCQTPGFRKFALTVYVRSGVLWPSGQTMLPS